MLTDHHAAAYECNVVMAGSLMMILIDLSTGHLIFWIMWVISLILVIMAYIDHACIGWKLKGSVQLRRMGTDFGFAVGCVLLLYILLWLLLPDFEMKSAASILNGIHRIRRIHTYLGYLFYACCYFLMYDAALGFYRIFYNLGVLVYIKIKAGMDKKNANNAANDPNA